MTEISYFWDGTATGDASAAAYSSEEFSDVFNILLGGDDNEAYVVPEYLNELKVTESSPAAMSVDVASGGAFVRGRLYESDASETLTISTASVSNPRIDRIVLRVTFASQTIRLAVLTGTAAASPSPPALTQNTTTYEVELAQVWVGTSVSSIVDADIKERRLFLPSFKHQAQLASQTNLITDSEHLAAGESAGTTFQYHWNDRTTVGYSVTGSLQTKPDQQARGNAILVQAATGVADGGIQTDFTVKKSTMYAIRMLVKPVTNDTFYVNITTNSASPNTITYNLKEVGGGWLDLWFYYETESDGTNMRVQVYEDAGATGGECHLGQVMVFEGYLTGDYRQFRETLALPFVHEIDSVSGISSNTQQSVNLQTACSGTYTFIAGDLSAVFIRGILNDSSASGNNVIIAAGPRWELADGTSSTDIELPTQLAFLLDKNTIVTNYFPIGTMSASFEITGIVT